MTVGALPSISCKLDSLIRRLSTDKDAEALACVRAIGRQLDKVGLTFHDLADTLTSAPDTPTDGAGVRVFYDYARAVEWLLSADCGDLTDRDTDFLVSMRGILYRFPPRTKQAAWIRGLVEKLGARFDG